ncbi:MAG: cell division protein SepF [Bacillota bacterium]|jgi:cell division inhibitor SepF
MGLLEKVSNLFYKEEDYEEDDIIEEEEVSTRRRPISMPNERPVYKDQEYNKRSRRNNIMSIPTNANRFDQPLEMVLVRATSYDDMQEIANNIKEQKIVVVNFEDMDKGLAQRMVDFLSGAVFALDGMPKKVSGGTFIFSSSKVDLSGQIMDSGLSFSDKFSDTESTFKSSRFFRK